MLVMDAYVVFLDQGMTPTSRTRTAVRREPHRNDLAYFGILWPLDAVCVLLSQRYRISGVDVLRWRRVRGDL